MLQSLLRCYERFRLSTYRSMFTLLRERDGSLSATEAFSVDVIYLLRGPTIKEFADCLGISQPNATYKVNQLIQGGDLLDIAPAILADIQRDEPSLQNAPPWPSPEQDNS